MRAFRVTVRVADEDDASAALWDAGTLGIEVRPHPTGSIELLAYFPDLTEAADIGRRLPQPATVEPCEIPEVDWVARFRDGFRSFAAGRFRVVPVWELSSHASEGTRPTDVDLRDTLVVDPGRAFGTGTHETTRLCLAAIEALAKRRSLGRTLDLGAGTGILAVAADRLGASAVVASDLDAEAISSAALHLRLNRAHLHLVRADGARGFKPHSFDLVLANLMALLLVERAPEICALLAPHAALVLSGLLSEDVPHVRRVFDDACGRPAERVDGEWAALVYEDVP